MRQLWIVVLLQVLQGSIVKPRKKVVKTSLKGHTVILSLKKGAFLSTVVYKETFRVKNVSKKLVQLKKKQYLCLLF